MKYVGVTRKQYVDEWIDLDLIPGAVHDRENNTYSFLDSSRRPYRCGALKAGISADKIRSHIVKAAIAREHIFADMCFMSPLEFETMFDDLEACGLVRRRVEDGITYIDSTEKSEMYKGKKLGEIGKFVKECLAVVAESAAKGAVKGALEVAITAAVA